MAKFSIVRTTRTPPAVGPSVRANINVDTGEQELTKAWGSVGEAIFNLGLKRKRNENLIALSNAVTGLDTYSNKRLLNIIQTQLSSVAEADALKAAYPNDYQTETNRLSEELNEETRAKFLAYAGRNFGVTQFRFDNALYKQKKILYQGQLSQAFEFYFNTEPVEPLAEFPWRNESEYEAAHKNWELRHQEWERKLAGIKGIYSRILPPDVVEAQEIYALVNAKRFNKARETLRRAKFLLPQDIMALETFIRTAESAYKTQIQLATEQKDDAIGETFLRLLINKLDPTKEQLTFTMISESDLSPPAKDKWLVKLRVFDSYSAGKLEEAFQDKGSILADILERVEENTITNDEIRDQVGKGLSPTTAQSIIDKREIWRQYWHKETEKLFKRLFGWTPELGYPNNLAEALYEKTLREWREQIKEKEPTGEEIIELGREIARPYFIEHLQKMLQGQEEDIPRIIELALGEVEEVEEETIPFEEGEPTEEKLEKYRKLRLTEYRSPSGRLYDLTKEEPTKAKEEEKFKLGEIRQDAQGQSWEYIGDNKWRKK